MPVSRMSRAVAKTKKKPAPGAKRSKAGKPPKKAEQRTLNAERETLALQSAKAEVIASQRYALALESLNENLYDWDIENDSVYYAPGHRGRAPRCRPAAPSASCRRRRDSAIPSRIAVCCP